MGIKILTHGDTDGICAAALARYRFPDAEIWFTRPIRLLRDLNAIEPGTAVMIFDVAIDEANKDKIFQRMRELAQKDEVLYADHHPLPPGTLKRDFPVTQFALDTGASSSELAFKLLIQDPKSDMDRVALWGAIADYCWDTEFVRGRMDKYDRRTIYMEAGLLTQGLGEAAGDYHFKRDIVIKLAQGIPPTEMPDLVDRALRATKREWDVYEYVKKHVIVEDNIAVVYNLPVGSLGKAALYALGITGADVGICTRVKKDDVDISIRRRTESKIDLNELLRHITARVGGSGGGHEGAAGATVPVNLLETFLDTIKREVSPIRSLGEV
ncbi:MAG: DHHA1 domain-containing protein [Candidatus Hadarchaeaceae archaeon]